MRCRYGQRIFYFWVNSDLMRWKLRLQSHHLDFSGRHACRFLSRCTSVQCADGSNRFDICILSSSETLQCVGKLYWNRSRKPTKYRLKTGTRQQLSNSFAKSENRKNQDEESMPYNCIGVLYIRLNVSQNEIQRL